MAQWLTVFEKRRNVSRATWNTPYLESNDAVGEDDDQTCHRFGEEDEEEDQADRDEEWSEIRKFMGEGLAQADKVVDFCRGSGAGASLASLRSGNGKAAIQKNAWLDERSGESHEDARQDAGPLTALDLYRKLKKQRFRVSEPNQASTSLNPTEMHQEEPDAERQAIFVNDLDSWIILSLIGTAPKQQVPHLQAALDGYLSFEPFFGLDITSGPLMFRLAFHLPYYVLKVSKEARTDPRKYANGDPLRQVHNVSFLDWKKSKTSTFLYEAQISCVVAGPDEWRWIAYCFIDTYFQEPEERETVSSYYDTSQSQDVRLDPFTRGETLADGKLQNPRENFLMVLKYRLEQVANEWRKVVEELRKRNREYRNIFLSCSRRQFPSEARERVTKGKWLSRRLSLDLKKTVDFCEQFCCQPAVNFQSMAESEDPCPLIDPIRTILKQLTSLNMTLESMAHDWDDFTRDVEIRLNSETIRVAHYSVNIILLISPIALAASILSMDHRFIPFMPLDFRSFLCTMSVFGVIGAVIHLVWFDRFRPHLDRKIWGERKRWDHKIAAPSLKTIRLPSLSTFFGSAGTGPHNERQDVHNRRRAEEADLC